MPNYGSTYAGLRIGCLTAVRPLFNDKHGRTVWLWLCECGRKLRRVPAAVRQKHLARKEGGVCCLTCTRQRERQRFELSGKKFGDVTVLGRAKRPGYWRCRCGCGRKIIIRRSNLIRRPNPVCPLCRYAPMLGDGAKVRSERMNAGLTLADAGKLLGVSRQCWQQWEARERIKPKRLNRLLAVLKPFVDAKAGRKKRTPAS
jgi:DNA-binding XRE family transcriptional regulator